MQDPRGLFEFADEIPDVGSSPTLVQALDGFIDAGSATHLARTHLTQTLRTQPVATFDIDRLFDYRGRRPEMIFETDHWQSYATPQLQLLAAWDADERPFLLLAGPEPDFQWERFVAAIELLMETFGTTLVVGLNSIPMNVPHTRPMSVIAHGNPVELISGYTNWIGTVSVPASAGHLLEFRLAEAGFQSMGFAVNVPHYLANIEYPQAAITLLDCVATSAGLRLPTDDLTEAAKTVRGNIDAQVAASDEIAQIVHALEEQFDEVAAGRSNSLLAQGARLPTAEEIGAEFERFLLGQDDPGTGDEPV